MSLLKSKLSTVKSNESIGDDLNVDFIDVDGDKIPISKEPIEKVEVELDKLNKKVDLDRINQVYKNPIFKNKNSGYRSSTNRKRGSSLIDEVYLRRLIADEVEKVVKKLLKQFT